MEDTWKPIGELEPIKALAEMNAFHMEQRAKGYAVEAKFDRKALRNWVKAQAQAENEYLRAKGS